jgi:hypothetical protein
VAVAVQMAGTTCEKTRARTAVEKTCGLPWTASMREALPIQRVRGRHMPGVRVPTAHSVPRSDIGQRVVDADSGLHVSTVARRRTARSSRWVFDRR